jgi:LL-H family phage holin
MINDLIFNVCLALVVGICGVIAKELIPLIREKHYEVMKALEATKWAWAVDIINEVVKAVEQTVIEKHGEEKKAVAHQLIWKAFKEAGISMSEQQVDALIEAAVHAMNGEKAICE